MLYGGLALGLVRSPRNYFWIVREIKKEWKAINRKALSRAIKVLYQSKLVSEKENSDGSTTLVLTEAGKQKALTYTVDEMEIKKPKVWDKKWRFVLYDIHDSLKPVRDAFRDHIKQLGFYEFQRSVFIHPYDCKNEIDFLIELHDIRHSVRLVTATEIDNEPHLKEIFSLD